MVGGSKSLVELFKDRFEANSGVVHVVEEVGDAVGVFEDIFSSEDVGRFAVARLPQRFGRFFAGLDARDVGDNVAEADVGITWADYGIADTGTIVEITEMDRDRLVSSLPRIHVALLKKDRILPRLEAMAEIIREKLSEKTLRNTITFISGPSRTSDIELRTVLGVHGPHSVHVLVFTRW